MLRPLLLLCWAATIVSAGDLSSTNVSSNPPGDNASANPLPTPQPILQESNVETNPIPPAKNAHTTNDSMETPKVIPLTMETANLTPPITKPTITQSTTTTTTSTTTTSTTTKLTTTKSTTTTTPTPTTTVAPTTPAPITPLPSPDTGKWIVQENNTLCIVLQMAVQFNVSYTNSDNVTYYKAMNVPINGTNTTGNCGKTEQNITLSWESQNKTILNNFTIHFVKNETEKYYSLHHFEIALAAKEFPNDKSNKTVTVVHMVPQFQTGLSNSYRCIKEQKLDLTPESNKNVTVGLLKVAKLQFQAFRGDNTTTFGLPKDCSFDTPDIVPITVGCALAGLVVIVLIAYLVGRRRSQTRGYLSM